jgi:hypothetical protein
LGAQQPLNRSDSRCDPAALPISAESSVPKFPSARFMTMSAEKIDNLDWLKAMDDVAAAGQL